MCGRFCCSSSTQLYDAVGAQQRLLLRHGSDESGEEQNRRGGLLQGQRRRLPARRALSGRVERAQR